MALSTRFAERIAALGLARADAHLLVAVSGGVDSIVLLHLLRFALEPRPALTVAHFDHRMRPGSDADARWLTGVCRAWGVPLVCERAGVPLRGETAARRARYAFLIAAAERAGATHVATAHHADDQAETVLFRALRGTGVGGLAGIAEASAGGLVRPLLRFWRREIRRYARATGLRWRTDPTNRLLLPARNRLRREILPRVERRVAPGARRNLVRLAGLARDDEAAWDAVLEVLRPPLARSEADALVLARQPFRDYHRALASRLLRHLLRRFGTAPSRAGTRMALQFITDAPSGREMQLPGGLRLVSEFDEVRIGRAQQPDTDRPLRIASPSEPGSGELLLAGCRFRVTWSRGRGSEAAAADASSWGVALDLRGLRFPLTLRAWQPGDRIRLAAGRRRLKKLFGELRVPRTVRARTPVLADADAAVLWVAGRVQSPATLPRPDDDALLITVRHG